MAGELKDQRVPIMMSASDLAALDAWRRGQTDLPSRGEAIRRLIDLGLKAGPAGGEGDLPGKTDRRKPREGV